MAGRMFRIGLKVINLTMVTHIQERPSLDWSTDEDEKSPRLFVQLIGNSGFELTTREAIAAGFPDIAACEAALIAALDSYNG